MSFKRATKKQKKLRLALSGISGSGKTYTSLLIASGLSDKIAVIDTERGSSSMYADVVPFDSMDLNDHSVNGYISALQEAAKCGYEVVIIDSLSHGWEWLISEVDNIAASQFKNNSYYAWSKGTPMQKQLITTILTYPGHVIATMRVKTSYVVEGKTPKKVGTVAIQGKGIEYEFDVLVRLSDQHIAYVEKDRTNQFQDQHITKPDASFGKAMLDWLNSGEPLGITEKQLNGWLNKHGLESEKQAIDILNDCGGFNGWPSLSEKDKWTQINECIKQYKTPPPTVDTKTGEVVEGEVVEEQTPW